MKTDQYSPMLRQKIIVRNNNVFGSPTIQFSQSLNSGPTSFVSQFNKTPERVRLQQVTQIYPVIQNISTLMLPPNVVDLQTNRKDNNYNEPYQTTKISPINSPQGKRKYMNTNSNEDNSQQKLNKTIQQLQAVQAENEILKTQLKNNQPGQDYRFTSHKNSDSKKQSSQLQEAVQRMEIEKLRFELQSKDRCINFLEDRLRVEEEERMRINQMYSKRIDQEVHTNDHIAKLKEVNIMLEKTIKQQKIEYNLQLKEDIQKFNQKLIHLQQDLNEKTQQAEAYQMKYQALTDQVQSLDELNYLKQVKEELQKEIDELQSQNIQNEEYFVEQIKSLTSENEQLKQSVVSFDDQRSYFENELKQLQDYYQEITQENERLNMDQRDQFRPMESLLKEKQDQINSLREQLMFLKTEGDPQKIQKFALQSEQDFQMTDQQRSLSAQEIQEIADQYLNSDTDELDVNSLREMKKFLKYFRVRILEIYDEVKWLRQEKLIDSGALQDINQIKSYKPVSYPSKKSSEPENEQEIRDLQIKSDEIVGQIQERKQYLENQDSEDFIDNPNNEKVIEELEVLYQQHDTYQVQIQFLGEKMQKSNVRKQSSVSFDQSFDMQNQDI